MELERIEVMLNEIREIDGIKSTTLISRSGMHITGSVPQGAHLETFVAMSAILVFPARLAVSPCRPPARSPVITGSE